MAVAASVRQVLIPFLIFCASPAPASAYACAKLACIRPQAECTWICTNSWVMSLAGRPGQARASSRAVEAVQELQSIASCMHRAGLSGAAARLIWVNRYYVFGRRRNQGI